QRAELLDETIADGICRRAPCPFRVDEIAELTLRGGSGRTDRIKQQLAPALEKQRTILELDAEHVLRRGLVDAHQAITNQSRADAVGKSTFANRREHRIADNR